MADSGKGIPHKLLARVFERDISGNGSTRLELAICKEIVGEHDGMESESDGRGTTVRSTLPRVQEGERA